MYTLEKVTKAYGKVVVLNEVTCQIPTNEFVFVMGPSGSGKSTLLRLLSMVEGPNIGTLELSLGDNLYSSQGQRRPWPMLTSVFQRQFLWPNLTIRENVTLPLRGKSSSLIDKELQEVTDLFKMHRFIDRFPNEISGGEAQRAALARALVLKPKLILIDEAHSGLDLEQQQMLNQYLITLRRAGVGLVVVTHSLTFALEYAETVVIVDDHSVAEVGSSTVFANPQSRFLQEILKGSVRS